MSKSRFIKKAFIDDLVKMSALSDVVGRVVKLKRAGNKGRYTGLCPFHNERTPSFHVDDSRGVYHCFGCKKSGNIITFLQDYHGYDYPTAIEELANIYGKVVEYEESYKSEQQLRQERIKEEQRRQAIAVLSGVANLYSNLLRTAPQAQAYLEQRGINHAMVEMYKIGYSYPKNYLTNGVNSGAFGQIEGVKDIKQTLKDIYLIKDAVNKQGKPYERDSFQDRIMFPVFNDIGDIVAFGGRRIDGKKEAKYINSDNSVIYDKSKEIFGLWQVLQHNRKHNLKNNRVILVEGYLDVISLAQAGLVEAVSASGTAISTNQMRDLLRRFDQVILCMDGDDAGKKGIVNAVKQSLPILKNEHKLMAITLPLGEDPDSYIKSQEKISNDGKKTFDELISRSISGLRFLIEYDWEQLFVNSPDNEKDFAIAKFVENLAEYYVTLDEKTAYLTRGQVLSMAADISKINYEIISVQITSAAKVVAERIAQENQREQERQHAINHRFDSHSNSHSNNYSNSHNHYQNFQGKQTNSFNNNFNNRFNNSKTYSSSSYSRKSSNAYSSTNSYTRERKFTTFGAGSFNSNQASNNSISNYNSQTVATTNFTNNQYQNIAQANTNHQLQASANSQNQVSTPPQNQANINTLNHASTNTESTNLNIYAQQAKIFTRATDNSYQSFDRAFESEQLNVVNTQANEYLNHSYTNYNNYNDYYNDNTSNNQQISSDLSNISNSINTSYINDNTSYENASYENTNYIDQTTYTLNDQFLDETERQLAQIAKNNQISHWLYEFKADNLPIDNAQFFLLDKQNIEIKSLYDHLSSKAKTEKIFTSTITVLTKWIKVYHQNLSKLEKDTFDLLALFYHYSAKMRQQLRFLACLQLMNFGIKRLNLLNEFEAGINDIYNSYSLRDLDMLEQWEQEQYAFEQTNNIAGLNTKTTSKVQGNKIANGLVEDINFVGKIVDTPFYSNTSFTTNNQAQPMNLFELDSSNKNSNTQDSNVRNTINTARAQKISQDRNALDKEIKSYIKEFFNTYFTDYSFEEIEYRNIDIQDADNFIAMFKRAKYQLMISCLKIYDIYLSPNINKINNHNIEKTLVSQLTRFFEEQKKLNITETKEEWFSLAKMDNLSHTAFETRLFLYLYFHYNYGQYAKKIIIANTNKPKPLPLNYIRAMYTFDAPVKINNTYVYDALYDNAIKPQISDKDVQLWNDFENKVLHDLESLGIHPEYLKRTIEDRALINKLFVKIKLDTKKNQLKFKDPSLKDKVVNASHPIDLVRLGIWQSLENVVKLEENALNTQLVLGNFNQKLNQTKQTQSDKGLTIINNFESDSFNSANIAHLQSNLNPNQNNALSSITNNHNDYNHHNNNDHNNDNYNTIKDNLSNPTNLDQSQINKDQTNEELTYQYGPKGIPIPKDTNGNEYSWIEKNLTSPATPDSYSYNKQHEIYHYKGSYKEINIGSTNVNPTNVNPKTINQDSNLGFNQPKSLQEKSQQIDYQQKESEEDQKIKDKLIPKLDKAPF